jgi:hypothetical protein
VSNYFLQDWQFKMWIGYGLAIVRRRIANAQVAVLLSVFLFIGYIVIIYS